MAATISTWSSEPEILAPVHNNAVKVEGHPASRATDWFESVVLDHMPAMWAYNVWSGFPAWKALEGNQHAANPDTDAEHGQFAPSDVQKWSSSP